MQGPERGDRAVGRLMGVLLGICTAYAVSAPQRLHQSWMNFVQDDFFYYLKVAQNVAAGHGSTFNGLVPTNGYHPMWMWLLAGVVWAGAGLRGVGIFLGISIWFATMAMYALALLWMRRFGVNRVLGAVLAAYVAIYSTRLFEFGMEVTLATPLMLALLLAAGRTEWWSVSGGAAWRRCSALGLLASAMVLARLDSIILLMALLLCWMVVPQLRSSVRGRHIAGITIGLLPLGAYLLSNQRYFHTWIPISGMAKELKLDHGFTSPAWQGLLTQRPIHLLPVVGALVLLPWAGRHLRLQDRAITVAALSFPFLACAVLSWLSDWPTWPWYEYGLRPALCIAIALLMQLRPLRRLGENRFAQTALAVGVIWAMSHVGWPQQFPEIVDAAEQLRSFAVTHPGTYAMGDRSGAVGVLLPDPLVQTEGLMMDRPFLDLIATQTPLRTALRRYGARYYIATARTAFDGCFLAVEPFQAGPHAPAMRDTFCTAPVAQWNNVEVHTLVFDLQR